MSPHRSHFLTNELTVGELRRVLAPFSDADLGNPIARIEAYRKAGLSTETIRDFDRDALRLERLRREAMTPKNRASHELRATRAIGG